MLPVARLVFQEMDCPGYTENVRFAGKQHMQPGLAGPKKWVEVHEGLPDFGECPVVIARVIRAAVRTCDQTLGSPIDTLNLRVYVPLLIRNGVPFFILVRQC